MLLSGYWSVLSLIKVLLYSIEKIPLCRFSKSYAILNYRGGQYLSTSLIMSRRIKYSMRLIRDTTLLMIAKGLLVCDLSIVNERWKEYRKVGEIVLILISHYLFLMTYYISGSRRKNYWVSTCQKSLLLKPEC